MHSIWAAGCYDYKKAKLTLRGKDLGRDLIRYNVNHNEYVINAYKPISDIVDNIIHSGLGNKIFYLHGYPSLIFELANYLLVNNIKLLKVFPKGIACIFFGSEFPLPNQRDIIEKVFNCHSISWYGHSEMSVLAGEIEPYFYRPFHSYGYTEAISSDYDSSFLVGTSLHNFKTPFIRYNTEDLIYPVEYEDSLLKSFKVAQGRVGDFVTDSKGHKVSLTAMIFGRHHKIFEFIENIQVYQEKQGIVRLYITCQSNMSINQARELMDLNGLHFLFSFVVLSKPIRTSAGKTPLKITSGQLNEKTSHR